MATTNDLTLLDNLSNARLEVSDEHTAQVHEQRCSLFERLVSRFKHVYREVNFERPNRNGDGPYEGETQEDRPIASSIKYANVISSELSGVEAKGLHTIALDIDHPCMLLESATPGHYHLFIDVDIPWPRYAAILKAFNDAGIIEEGYYEASLRRQATGIRLPWVKKTWTSPTPPHAHLGGASAVSSHETASQLQSTVF